jgi:hypothetical protein
MTMCECKISYLAVVQSDGLRFRLQGSYELIERAYSAMPWVEHNISDTNGMFTYLEAPSLAAIEVRLASVKIR